MTRSERLVLVAVAALAIVVVIALIARAPAGSSAASPVPSPVMAAPPPDVEVRLEPFARGVDRPVGLAFHGGPSDGLFVGQQGGVVRLVVDGVLQPDPVLDLSDVVLVGGEQGLLGIVLHPEFAENGRFYVSYSSVERVTIVAEYVATDRAVADPGSVRELLRLPQESNFHKGGAMAFGPEGLLYVTIGDDAWPRLTTPDFSETLRGTIIRIDVDDPGTPDRPYGIPEGNAFAPGDGPPEVFDVGLRNPWRMSVDPDSGDLYVGDVGSERYEEIDRHRASEPAGLDYGWGAWEGYECRREVVREELDCSALSGAEPPVLVLEGAGFQSGDCAVIGGFVYRGEAIPALRGAYVFGDYCSGLIRAIATDGDRAEASVLLESGVAMSTFGVDESGELYLADVERGEIWRIVPGR